MLDIFVPLPEFIPEVLEHDDIAGKTDPAVVERVNGVVHLEPVLEKIPTLQGDLPGAGPHFFHQAPVFQFREVRDLRMSEADFRDPARAAPLGEYSEGIDEKIAELVLVFALDHLRPHYSDRTRRSSQPGDLVFFPERAHVVIRAAGRDFKVLGDLPHRRRETVFFEILLDVGENTILLVGECGHATFPFELLFSMTYRSTKSPRTRPILRPRFIQICLNFFKICFSVIMFA